MAFRNWLYYPNNLSGYYVLSYLAVVGLVTSYPSVIRLERLQRTEDRVLHLESSVIRHLAPFSCFQFQCLTSKFSSDAAFIFKFTRSNTSLFLLVPTNLIPIFSVYMEANITITSILTNNHFRANNFSPQPFEEKFSNLNKGRISVKPLWLIRIRRINTVKLISSSAPTTFWGGLWPKSNVM